MLRSVDQILAWRRQAIRWAEESMLRFVTLSVIWFAIVFGLGRVITHWLGDMRERSVPDGIVEGIVVGVIVGCIMWRRVADRARAK